MTTADDKRLRGATRWSMACKCPRMASLALLGADPEPDRDPARHEGRFQRGKDAQRFFGRKLVRKYGEEDVIPEKAVPWPAPPAMPIGELHTDFVIPSERLAIEVKSTDWPDSLFAGALEQLKGEIHWDADVDSGLLVMLDRDYQESAAYPAIVTDEDIARLEDTATQIVDAGKTSVLPERTCAHPGEGIGKFCPFIAQCFTGWQPPEVSTDESLKSLYAEGYLLKQQIDGIKKGAEEALSGLQEQWDEWKERALDADVPSGKSIAGPLELTRTDRRASRRFSLSKAEKAGFPLNEEVYGAFISDAAGSTIFSFKRIGEEPLEPDYGEAPF